MDIDVTRAAEWPDDYAATTIQWLRSVGFNDFADEAEERRRGLKTEVATPRKESTDK